MSVLFTPQTAIILSVLGLFAILVRGVVEGHRIRRDMTPEERSAEDDELWKW